MKSFNQFYTTKKDIFSLDEGVNDPAIFKAVFMAGGPGSGKSFIAGKTGLVALGLKLINSDDVFEKALAKEGMKTTPEDIFSEKGQNVVRPRAKALTAKKQDLALSGRLGLIIDGTGKNYERISKQRTALTNLGYDTLMIFVNTDKETALERNRERARKLPDDEVSKMWQSVQNNIGKFQGLFKRNFIVVDNSKGSDFQKSSTVAYKRASKWAKQAPENHLAKKWIDAEKERRGIKK